MNRTNTNAAADADAVRRRDFLGAVAGLCGLGALAVAPAHGLPAPQDEDADVWPPAAESEFDGAGDGGIDRSGERAALQAVRDPRAAPGRALPARLDGRAS